MAELDHGEGAVADDHDLALGLPAAYQSQQHIGVLRCRAVAPSELGADGWRECRNGDSIG